MIPTGLDITGDSTPDNFELPKGIVPIGSALRMWDSTMQYSFLNDTGIWKWIDGFQGNLSAVAELGSVFQLSSSQIGIVLNWLLQNR